MKFSCYFLLLSLVGCASTTPTPDCIKKPGFVGGPLVTTEENAIKIASAVLSELPRFQRQAPKTIFADDEDSYWQISAGDGLKEEAGEGDIIIVSISRNATALSIAKCDGRIFDLHYVR